MTTRGFRLARVTAAAGPDQWPLRVNAPTTIGRPDGAALPDVDLSPDRAVSRQHASLWQADGEWWIKDLGSRHGTQVGGHAIPANTVVRCPVGCPLGFGNALFTLLDPATHRLHGDRLVLDLHLERRLSYSLVNSKLAPRVWVNLYNWASSPMPPSTLRLSLAELAEIVVEVPALMPGEKKSLRVGAAELDPQPLLAVAEHQRLRWQAWIGEQRIDNDELECNVLPYKEWSSLAEHWTTLAAFVQPHHPDVAAMTRSATIGMPLQAGALATLQRLFVHLAEEWHLDYRKDPAPMQQASQRVRLGSDLLSDPQARKGEGTCLDIAVLLAAGLEALRLQPLLAVIDYGRSWHALVGVWNQSRRRLQTTPSETSELLADATWVDPNACTREPQQRAAFAVAMQQAQHGLATQPRLFVLDIAAARAAGVLPLPIVDTKAAAGGVA